MALENVEILFLFGFVALGLVIFQSGLRGNNAPDLFPIMDYNSAWTLCLTQLGIDPIGYPFDNIKPETQMEVISSQGVLICKNTKKNIGYHKYREKPDQWFDMDARKCDAQLWCNKTKSMNISTSHFAWTCDGTRIGKIWENHEDDPCPDTLDFLNKTQAESACLGGKIVALSKMWLCADKNSSSITELAWMPLK